MKTKHLAFGLLIGLSAAVQAVDLSKVPNMHDKDLLLFNSEEVKAGRRPERCRFVDSERDADPVCYDGVLSLSEAYGRYAKADYWLGKPLEKGNKAKENLAGLEAIIGEIEGVYGGTQKAILNKKENLDRITAGLFNTFNDAIRNVQPYVLSIAKGHYDKATLKKLDSFMNVFQNGWNRSVSAMVKFEGITQDDADDSTAYYRQELIKIRHIITQLNKYYQ